MSILQCLLRLNHLRAKLGEKPQGTEAAFAEILDRTIAQVSRLCEPQNFDDANVTSLQTWKKPNHLRQAIAKSEEIVVAFKKRA